MSDDWIMIVWSVKYVVAMTNEFTYS